MDDECRVMGIVTSASANDANHLSPNLCHVSRSSFVTFKNGKTYSVSRSFQIRSFDSRSLYSELLW